MILKIIDGVTDLLYNIIKVICFGSGAYSIYDMVYNLGIPIGFIVPFLSTIFFFAYFASEEDEKVKAVPVMMIQNGKPAKVDELRGIS